MRFTGFFVSALFLSACATPAPPASPAPLAAVGSGQANDIVSLLQRAGGADAPTPEAVQRVLGVADVARQDGGGVALTYRLEHCALLLLFAADARNEMRLREAHAGARRAGEAPPSLAVCASEAGARRT